MSVYAESLNEDGSWSVAIWQSDEGHGLTPIKQEVDSDGVARWVEDCDVRKLLTFDEAADLANDYANHVKEVQHEILRDKVYLIGPDGSVTEIKPAD